MSQTKRERRAAHRAEMRERRERQLARRPGFEIVPSRRVNGMFQTFLLEGMALNMSPLAAQGHAWDRVRQALPPPPMERRALPLRDRRPTRNDDPDYRKPWVRELRRTA
jgi:hypothetical protein